MSTATVHHHEHDPHWGALAVIVVATVLAAAIGGFASVDAQAFYLQLALPAWAPPASVFGPVWTLLYALMCAAAWLVVREVGVAAARPALQLFAAQLVANALWTWLFFHWRVGSLAFFDVLVLFALVALTARAFWRRRQLAGWLMLPVVVWVAFASALTFEIWQTNPGQL